MKTAVLSGEETAVFFSALREALKEISEMRRESRKLNSEINRYQNSTRQRLDRIGQELENVKAAR